MHLRPLPRGNVVKTGRELHFYALPAFFGSTAIKRPELGLIMSAQFSTDVATTNLEYALYYATLGCKVFPAHSISGGQCTCGKSDCTSPGKHPKTRNGLKDATTSNKSITQWWEKKPDANIAIRTGKESGLVVLDVDTKSNGFESLGSLQNNFDELPKTLIAETGSKGNHIFFKHPGNKLKTRAGILAGIDFRGDGGYIIAPPSLHISGGSYNWVDFDQPIADIPEWLVSLVNGGVKESQPECDETIIPEGRRNSR